MKQTLLLPPPTLPQSTKNQVPTYGIGQSKQSYTDASGKTDTQTQYTQYNLGMHIGPVLNLKSWGEPAHDPPLKTLHGIPSNHYSLYMYFSTFSYHENHLVNNEQAQFGTLELFEDWHWTKHSFAT